MLKTLINKTLTFITASLANGVIELTPIFVIVAIIGIFITMVGYRKVGTRISSLSFLIYILLRVVL